jgi:hypothetical protein
MLFWSAKMPWCAMFAAFRVSSTRPSSLASTLTAVLMLETCTAGASP